MAYRSREKFFENISKPLAKWQIKLLFAILAFSIILGVILFTQSLVKELVDREKKTLQLYAKINEDFNNRILSNQETDYLYFMLDNIIETINFPIIATDSDDKPQESFEAYTLNLGIDFSKPLEEQRKIVNSILQEMKEDYKPIIIHGQNNEVLLKFYYAHSPIIDQLRYFPLIAMVAVASFILIGYFAFSGIRRTEESKVWVGMAKEAAHQLGTPLSSLLAWIEILKYNNEDPSYVSEIIGEMEHDLTRLNTITTRFSKIGSQPEKELTNVSELIENVCKYYEVRLPNVSKKIEIIRDLQESYIALVNRDLFEWVIENLLKNATEAIEREIGNIYIYMRANTDQKIFIYVRDTGKGMNNQLKRMIFVPGYTTKKRGWGLGLSLVKRIVEDYHKGKIYIKESNPGKGTTFAIELPMNRDINNRIRRSTF